MAEQTKAFSSMRTMVEIVVAVDGGGGGGNAILLYFRGEKIMSKGRKKEEIDVNLIP